MNHYYSTAKQLGLQLKHKLFSWNQECHANKVEHGLLRERGIFLTATVAFLKMEATINPP